MTTQPAGRSTRSNDVVSGEIRAWLSRLNLRQRDLCPILGVSPGQVSARITGRVSWTLDELDVIAAALGITPAELTTPPPGLAGAAPVQGVAAVELPRLDSNQQPAGYPWRAAA